MQFNYQDCMAWQYHRKLFKLITTRSMDKQLEQDRIFRHKLLNLFRKAVIREQSKNPLNARFITYYGHMQYLINIPVQMGQDNCNNSS